MSIWFQKDISAEQCNQFGNNTMAEIIGIVFTEIGENYIKATMPVDHRTRQPYGILHGGASVVLAETLGSVASALVIDTSLFNCVGLEINANHLRSVKSGFVTGIASPIHLGGTTHIWDIRIIDESGRLICVSRLTVAILNKR